MAFKPKTYDLPTFFKHGAILDGVIEAFDSGRSDPAKGVVIPVQSQSEAISLVNALNRYRTAFKAQNDGKDDAGRYMALKVTKVNLEKDGEEAWGVLIVDRLAATPDYTLYDAESGTQIKVITL